MTDIPAPTMGQILIKNFLEPLDLSAYRLAKEIEVPVPQIMDILHDRRKITPDIALRLAREFRKSDRYFLDLQSEIDIRNIKEDLAPVLERIIPRTVPDNSQS